jgi:hypothetical protein
MEQDPRLRDGYSRRELLKGAPLLIAAGVMLSALARKPLLSRLGRSRRTPEMPEGSIFTPADDAHRRV